MSSDIELIKRRMLRELLVQAPVKGRCPAEKQADPEKLNELLRKCSMVLADFWAEWCGPCRLVEPVVAKVGEEYGDTLAVAKVNVDLNPTLAAAFEVYNIPTLVLFYKGKEARRFVGYSPRLYQEIVESVRSIRGASE
ncbi:MAG: thioredoxin domain-containing protein [Infirmifilum sp.]